MPILHGHLLRKMEVPLLRVTLLSAARRATRSGNHQLKLLSQSAKRADWNQKQTTSSGWLPRIRLEQDRFHRHQKLHATVSERNQVLKV